MVTCSRTVLASGSVDVSGNDFTCNNVIPVGVALFVEGIGGGGSGRPTGNQEEVVEEAVNI